MKDLNEFYLWAKMCVDKNKEATDPLNWMILARYCTELRKLKNSAGIPPLIKAMQEKLIGKHYRYTVYPTALKGKLEKLTMEMFVEEEAYASWVGVLKWDKVRKFFSITNPYCKSFPLKYCWIIGEIKAGD